MGVSSPRTASCLIGFKTHVGKSRSPYTQDLVNAQQGFNTREGWCMNPSSNTSWLICFVTTSVTQILEFRPPHVLTLLTSAWPISATTESSLPLLSCCT
jgi:hypothetical protein